MATGFLGTSVFGGAFLYIAQGPSSMILDSTWMWVLLIVVGVPTVLLLVSVVVLTLFHMCPAIRGRTTKEVFTGRRTRNGRTLFRFRGQSLIQARTRVSYPMTVV